MKFLYPIPFLLCLCGILSGCRYFSKYNLHVPDAVTVAKDSTDIRFPGTRVFIQQPHGYFLVPQMVRIQHSPYDYISVFEDGGASFGEEKQAFLKEARTIFYEQDFRLGNYPALLSYGKDPVAGIEKITLLFGDSTFTVRAVGRWPAGLTDARKDILRALLSMYVDKHVIAHASDIQAFTADFTGTGFAPSTAKPPVFIYTLDGRPYSDDTSRDVLVITTSLPSPTDTSMKALVDNLLGGYKDRGVNFQQAIGQEKTIGSMPAYEYVGVAEINHQFTTSYLLATGDSTTLITVIGSFTTRPEQLVKEAQKITGTLRVKAVGE
jgi:hypothetical protein